LENREIAEKECDVLLAVFDRENILEKKAKIYSRLLTDPALAKIMEECSARHQKRKEKLLALALGKDVEKIKGGGRCEMNKECAEK